MIDGIRRLAKSIDKDPWDANTELEPAVEQSSEVPTDTAVLLAATQALPGFAPGDDDLMEYYRNVMRTAIQNGGKYCGHQIPVPWLRMILAGLESRYIDPETMWYEMDAEGSVNPLPEIPAYDDLFPSDRDPPLGPR